MTRFAIITFRDKGPLKNWQAIRAGNVHNARTQPLAHAMPDAPRPKHLVGTGNLERDVKRQMRATSIDPMRLRKNGVIAYEAILTASAVFFDTGTPEERKQRLDAWTKVQVDWAMKRYGPHRVMSMVLHEDEKVPHIHLIVLPLEVKSDKHCTDKAAMPWKLVGRTISGLGKFDEVQDVYSETMAQFGLVRGAKAAGGSTSRCRSISRAWPRRRRWSTVRSFGWTRACRRWRQTTRATRTIAAHWTSASPIPTGRSPRPLPSASA